MSHQNRLDQIRRTAAEILARAVLDFDRKTFLIQGGIDPCSFYYDFIFVNPIKKELLPLIEERMWQIVAADEEIKVHEMLPTNAAQFIRHHHHPYPAHFAEISPHPTVEVIQTGNFVDHVQGPLLQRAGELSAFKLLRLEARSDLEFKGEKKKVFRIIGVADETKETLKTFIKHHKQSIGVNHLMIGEAMQLFKVERYRDKNHFEKGRIYWTGQGETLLHHIYQYWRKLHLDAQFELIVTDGVSMEEGHQTFYKLSHSSTEKSPVQYAEYRTGKLSKGFHLDLALLDAKHPHQDSSHLFCQKKDLSAALQSSLPFLDQLPKQLEFNYTLALTGEEPLLSIGKEVAKAMDVQQTIYQGKGLSIEWKIIDDVGRIFKGPFLTVQKINEIFVIKQALFSSVERMIALILESREKDLSQKKELLSRMARE